MASSPRYPSCSWARWHSGITADFGSGYRPMISRARTSFSADSRAISDRPLCFFVASPGNSPAEPTKNGGWAVPSAVDFSHDGIDRRDDGHAVGDQAAVHHVGQGLEVDEA